MTHRKSFTFDGVRYDVRAASEAELAVKVAMKKRDLEEGKMRISRNTLVREWAEKWKATYKEPAVSDKTMSVINGVLNAHVLPAIGTMQLKDVKPVHCQSILNNVSGRSKSLVHKIRNYMADMFDKALDNKLILSNPAAKLSVPATTDGSHRAITDAERKLLLEVCETHKHGLWALIMLYCGLRPGETARVLGAHINAANRTLYVDGTKTKAARRNVPIPDVLFDKLAPFAAQPFQFICTDQFGQPMSKTSRNRAWTSLRKAMHIAAGGRTDYGEKQRIVAPFVVAADFVPYCLRHTYCTDLQAAGVPINVAKEFMGHSSIAMTANIYTHSSAASFETARTLINASVASGVAIDLEPLAK